MKLKQLQGLRRLLNKVLDWIVNKSSLKREKKSSRLKTMSRGFVYQNNELRGRIYEVEGFTIMKGSMIFFL